MKFKGRGGEEGRSKAEIFLYTEQRNPEREGRRNPINQKKKGKKGDLYVLSSWGGAWLENSPLYSHAFTGNHPVGRGVSLFFLNKVQNNSTKQNISVFS